MKKIIYTLILIFIITMSTFGQKYKVTIKTGENKGGVYSSSSFKGETPFIGEIDLDRMETVYVIAENGIFSEISEKYLKSGKVINVAAIDISKLKDLCSNIAFKEIKSDNILSQAIYTTGYSKKSSFQQEEINKAFKEIITKNEIFTSKENATYELLGTYINDYPISEQALTSEKNYATIAKVNWKLVHTKSGKIVFDKEIVGGHYFGKLMRVNLGNYYEDQYYSGKKAILNTLTRLLMNDEFTKAVKSTVNFSETKFQEQLEILSGNNFCSSIDKCITATITIKTENSFGSGFIISNNGYIITNYHVINDDQYPIVTLSNGISIKAKIIRINPETDIALLKVELEGLPTLKLNTESDYKAGDDIFVIGTPENIVLGQTLTKGIISGVRSDKEELIQIDASVNRGNSGGPLLNQKNEVIGVVTAKLIGVGTEGIGFAIPIIDAMKALNIEIKK